MPSQNNPTAFSTQHNTTIAEAHTMHKRICDDLRSLLKPSFGEAAAVERAETVDNAANLIQAEMRQQGDGDYCCDDVAVRQYCAHFLWDRREEEPPQGLYFTVPRYIFFEVSPNHFFTDKCTNTAFCASVRAAFSRLGRGGSTTVPTPSTISVRRGPLHGDLDLTWAFMFFEGGWVQSVIAQKQLELSGGNLLTVDHKGDQVLILAGGAPSILVGKICSSDTSPEPDTTTAITVSSSDEADSMDSMDMSILSSLSLDLTDSDDGDNEGDLEVPLSWEDHVEVVNEAAQLYAEEEDSSVVSEAMLLTLDADYCKRGLDTSRFVWANCVTAEADDSWC